MFLSASWPPRPSASACWPTSGWRMPAVHSCIYVSLFVCMMRICVCVYVVGVCLQCTVTYMLVHECLCACTCVHDLHVDQLVCLHNAHVCVYVCVCVCVCVCAIGI